jgi:hypothetical protein
LIFQQRIIAQSLADVNILGRSRLIALIVNALDLATQASTRAGIEYFCLEHLLLFSAA